MTLPVLSPQLRIALNRALQMPKHFMHGGLGLGAREVQAYIAMDWDATVIAPRVLHEFWRECGITKIFSPQYLRLHPQSGKSLVIDTGCGGFRSVWDMAQGANKLCIRQTYSNTVAPVEIKQLGRWK